MLHLEDFIPLGKWKLINRVNLSVLIQQLHDHGSQHYISGDLNFGRYIKYILKICLKRLLKVRVESYSL